MAVAMETPIPVPLGSLVGGGLAQQLPAASAARGVPLSLPEALYHMGGRTQPLHDALHSHPPSERLAFRLACRDTAVYARSHLMQRVTVLLHPGGGAGDRIGQSSWSGSVQIAFSQGLRRVPFHHSPSLGGLSNGFFCASVSHGAAAAPHP